MTQKDEFRILVGGYFGIQEMDEYDLKVYVMKDIETYIKNYISLNSVSNFDYQLEAEKIKDTVSLKRKLQDSLLTLKKIDSPLELELLVKARLKKMKEEDY